jgi:hypothetical protein
MILLRSANSLNYKLKNSISLKISIPLSKLRKRGFMKKLFLWFYRSLLSFDYLFGKVHEKIFKVVLMAANSLNYKFGKFNFTKISIPLSKLRKNFYVPSTESRKFLCSLHWNQKISMFPPLAKYFLIRVQVF